MADNFKRRNDSGWSPVATIVLLALALLAGAILLRRKYMRDLARAEHFSGRGGPMGFPTMPDGRPIGPLDPKRIAAMHAAQQGMANGEPPNGGPPNGGPPNGGYANGRPPFGSVPGGGPSMTGPGMMPGMPPGMPPQSNMPNQNAAAVQHTLHTLDEINRVNEMNRRMMEEQQRNQQRR